MKSRGFSFAVALAVAGVALFWNAPAQAHQAKKPQPKDIGQDKNDYVRLTNGTTVPGKVTKDDVNGVVVISKSGSQPYRQEEVAMIEYHAPKDYIDALASYESGSFDKAIGEFRRLKDSRDIPTLLQQYVIFYLAVSHKNRQRWADAAREFQDLRARSPKTRFLREAFEQELMCHIQNKNVAAARDLLGKIDMARADLNPQFPEMMKTQFADTLMTLGRENPKFYEEAQKEYSALASSANPETASRATAGEIEALLETKKYQELEQLCASKLQSGSGTAAAAAHLGMGLLTYRKAEESEKKPNAKFDAVKAQYTEALNHLIETSVRFPQHAKSPMAKIQLKAMWYTTLIYIKLKNLFEKMEKQPNHKMDATYLSKAIKQYRIMAMYSYQDIQANYMDLLDTAMKTEVIQGLAKLQQEYKEDKD